MSLLQIQSLWSNLCESTVSSSRFMALLSQGSELATLWLPALSLNHHPACFDTKPHITSHECEWGAVIPYQRLQFLCTVLPAGWSSSACLQGHMSTGTHWPDRPEPVRLDTDTPAHRPCCPPAPHSIQPSHRSAQDVPHRPPTLLIHLPSRALQPLRETQHFIHWKNHSVFNWGGELFYINNFYIDISRLAL